MSRSKGQICLNMWYLRKGLVPRNTYEKYQSSSIHCPKVIRKLNVSDRITVTKLWNDRQEKTICPPPPSSISGERKSLCLDCIKTILDNQNFQNLLTQTDK